MPISLAQGHIRSPEFKININSGFWIWVEVDSGVDDAGVSCLIGYQSDYCQKNNVHELRASWSLSNSGKILAQGDTNHYRGALYGISSEARGVGSFEVSPGDRYVLDADILEDYRRFDGDHPRLATVTSGSQQFDDEKFWILLFSTLLVATGMTLVVYTIATWIERKNDYQSVSLTAPGPLPGGFRMDPESAVVESQAIKRPRVTLAWIGLVLVLGGIGGYFEIPL